MSLCLYLCLKHFLYSDLLKIYGGSRDVRSNWNHYHWQPFWPTYAVFVFVPLFEFVFVSVFRFVSVFAFVFVYVFVFVFAFVQLYFDLKIYGGSWEGAVTGTIIVDSLPDLRCQIMYAEQTHTRKIQPTDKKERKFKWNWDEAWRDVVIFWRGSVFTAFVTNGYLCWWDTIPAGQGGIYLKGGLTKHLITVTRWLSSVIAPFF